ncbi:MAG: hypothetical protein DRP09_16445 [Candidatus Thorarchaeota archaeon]|nr:MAG: hypothetical protein DRP09_16445 [Candidatus Thorarchaeota archaeon]
MAISEYYQIEPPQNDSYEELLRAFNDLNNFLAILSERLSGETSEKTINESGTDSYTFTFENGLIKSIT